jgi:hypothetical protein
MSSKKEIYGEVPDRLEGDASVVNEALADLGSSFSNKINGPVKDTRRVEYDPEDGK